MNTRLLSIFGVVVALASILVQAQDYSCGPSKPCKLGCCSKGGYCGFGPDFCAAANCTSSCDAKSECNPGFGSQWAQQDKCPLNVCCSKYGFCGTTKDFCGNTTVKEPSCGGKTASSRTIGYYEGWSTTRPCDGMDPEAIPAGAYTHLNYAFAFIDPSTFTIAPMAESDKALYSRVTGLKQSYPGLQVWISVGGWSMNDPDQPTASTFSKLAASTSAQNTFANSLVNFMRTYGFDGVDIDWEYPVAPERSGNKADFANYPTLLSNIRKAFGLGGQRYGLSITLPSSYWYMRNFDIVKLEPLVDFLNIMTYDLHGTWDSTDPYIGAYAYAHTNLTEINESMDLLWRNNIPPAKVNMGLGFYGRSFTLANPSCKTAGCPFSSGANPGKCSATSGVLLNSEIEDIIKAGATQTLDSKAGVQIVTWDTNQWVSYDNNVTLKMKMDYANGKCLGGTLVWAVSTDNANADSAAALAKINGIDTSKLSLMGGGYTPPQPRYVACQWSPTCDAKCPAGLTPAQYGSGKSTTLVQAGTCSGAGRAYCCPPTDVPSCVWRGDSPFCTSADCQSDEVQVATDSGGCAFNHMNLCCKKKASDAIAGQCAWQGSAPFCGNPSCPNNLPDALTTSTVASGGEQPCFTGTKKFCCVDPIPYHNCGWIAKDDGTPAGSGIFDTPLSCAKGCQAGQQPVANFPCLVPGTAEYFCCDTVKQVPPTTGGNPNYCSVPDDHYVLAGGTDPDGGASDTIELFWYEDTCYGIPNTGNPDTYFPYKRDMISMRGPSHAGRMNRTRAAPAGRRNDGHPKICYENDDCWNILDPLHDVEFIEIMSYQPELNFERIDKFDIWSRIKERARRVAKICLGKGVQSGFVAKSYPGTNSLSNTGRRFFSAAVNGGKSGLCAALPLLSSQGRQAAIRYVTEHVAELQTPAQWANSMILGRLPSGAAAPGGSYDWTKIFDPNNGLIFKTWGQLGINAPQGLPGDTPHDCIMNAMGTTANSDNLQILDAATNSLKAAVWQIFKNIISDSRFADQSDAGRVAMTNRLGGTLIDYLKDPTVGTSLQKTFQAIADVLGTMDRSSQIGTGGSFTLKGSFITYTKDFFPTMTSNLQDFLKKVIPDQIQYWSSSDALLRYGPSAAQNAQFLKDKLANLATAVVIKAPTIN